MEASRTMSAASDKQMLTSGLFNNCSVLADCVDKMHCVRAETAEASEGVNLNCNRVSMMTSTESLSRLTGGKTGGDGHADVSTIVERAAIFELRIVQGKAASCTDIARKTLRPGRGEKLDHTCMNFCHSVTITFMWPYCSAPVDHDGKGNSEDTGIHAQQPINLLRATPTA